jgi:hypothetical protein
MGDRWLGPDDVVAFVDAAQEDVAEVNRPDAVVDLLEPDRMRAWAAQIMSATSSAMRCGH